MTRPNSRARHVLPVTIVALAALALAVPGAWQGWVTPVGTLVELLAAPLSGPVLRVRRWMAPVPRKVGDESTAALEEQIAQMKTDLLAARSQRDEYATLLQQARVVPPGSLAAVEQFPTTVLAVSQGGTVTLRAGSADGVQVGDVATAGFLHLMGRVVEVSRKTCTVRLITSRGGPALDAVVVVNESGATLRARVTPGGDGTLAGEVEDKRDPGGAFEPKVGQEVRLSDPSGWPGHAQMLLIGTVEKVEPSAKQQLRKIVTVRPALADMAHASQVVLRLSPPTERKAASP